MKKIKKVLIVDDSKLARLTLERLLNSQGISVIEASSVADAMQMLSEETVDAIFWDVQMPEQSGFDGLRLVKEDARLRHIPCSMYSGDLSQDAQQEAISRGAQAYLFKPANREHVAQVIETLARNVIADDMQQYALPEQNVVVTGVGVSEQAQGEAERLMAQVNSRFTQQNRQIEKHQKALIALDGRTRNLARLFNQQKKKVETLEGSFTERVGSLETELVALKADNDHAKNDDLLHKRAENDIRGELKRMRDHLRKAFTIAIISMIVATFASVLAIILYVQHL